MPKSKDIKLPKYLKLNKGTMWLDNDPEDKNSSGVRLFNTGVEFVGRGYLSNEDMAIYNESGTTPNKPIPKDKNKNEDVTHNSYGYVINEKDRSYFCTDDIPKDKIGNILTAIDNNILIPFNPKKKKPKVEEKPKKREQVRNFEYQDGDLVFVGKNKPVYKLLNKSSFEELKAYIEKSKNRSDLQDMLQYELKGYNRLSRARGEVMDLIRHKLNNLGPGITPIRVNDIDDKRDN